MSHKYPLCLITWEDTAGKGGWSTIEEATEAKTVQVQTVGWILHKDKERVVVVASLDDNGTCADRNTIPRNAIKNIKRIDKE